MNSFGLFGDGAITRKKKKMRPGKLCIMRHALRPMMQFPSYFSGDTQSPNKKINFIP
jgi:hypothetical protein